MQAPLRLLLLLAGVLVCAQTAPLAAQPAATPSATAAKRAPQAKTQQEYADYTSAYAISGGAAVEKAAGDFAAKYPQSELRVYLYAKAMHEYQNENNAAKMLAVAQQVLALDPDNSVALALTATVLADGLTPNDAKRTEQIAAITKNARRLLDTVDSAFTVPAGATADQVAAYKNTLRAMAHGALGIMELKTDDNAGAERDLQASADLGRSQPDAYVWYHLALAQDHLRKYRPALDSIDRALALTGANPELARLAQTERTRLVALSGAPPPTAPKP